MRPLRGIIIAATAASSILLCASFLASCEQQNVSQQQQQQQQQSQQHHKHQQQQLNANPLNQPLPGVFLTAPASASDDGSHEDQMTISNAQLLSSSMLKAFIRTNSMRAYHLDLHSYRDDAKFAGDPNFVNSSSLEHLDRCWQHLNQYHQLLKSFHESDAVPSKHSMDSIKLVDTFGRPPAAILSGNQFWLGAYENCLDFKHQTVDAHYCLGVAQFPNWNPQDTKTSLKVGLCLPETCTSSMISDNQHLLDTVETMMKYQFGDSQHFNKLKLRQVYCLPHETSQVRQYSNSAIAFFLFIGSFVVACLVATTVDYFDAKLEDKSNKQPPVRNWRVILVDSFSLRKNLSKFLHIRPDDNNQVDLPEGSFDRSVFLSSMTGLKCIGLFWIICAHSFLVVPIASRNLIDTDKLTKTYLADIYLTAHLMVDTFFALSGLLASYLIFKEGVDRIKTSSWIVMTVHRYWRLTPIYLTCYWFTKSVGFLINTGPLWDYMTAEHSPRLNCARESWWEAVLHLSDFKSPKEHCVPFAWFIANGIKFWMVTPFLIVLIHKSFRRGYATVAAIIAANLVLVATLAMNSKVDMKSVIEFKPESADNMLNNMGEIYTRPYSRIGAYLIGLLAGHLIYRVDTNQLEVKLSKNSKVIIWTLFSVTIILLTFVLKIAKGIQLEDAAIPWVFGIMAALIRPLWATCTCWFVFALAHGQARWVSRFLSASFWRILVKLSFCAYLAQGEVIAQLYLSQTFSEAFTYTSMITSPIVTIIFTLVVSLLMLLFLEYPLTGIEELILPKHQKSSTSKTSIVEKTHNMKLKST